MPRACPGKANIWNSMPDTFYYKRRLLPHGWVPGRLYVRLKATRGQAPGTSGSGQGAPLLREPLPPLDQPDSLFSLTGACRWQKPLGAICCHQAGPLPLNCFQRACQPEASPALFYSSVLRSEASPAPAPPPRTCSRLSYTCLAGGGGPGVAGGEQRTAQAAWPPALVHVGMSDDSCQSCSWYSSLCQGHGAPATCVNVLSPPGRHRPHLRGAAAAGRGLRLLAAPEAQGAATQGHSKDTRILEWSPHRLAPPVNAEGRGVSLRLLSWS